MFLETLRRCRSIYHPRQPIETLRRCRSIYHPRQPTASPPPQPTLITVLPKITRHFTTLPSQPPQHSTPHPLPYATPPPADSKPPHTPIWQKKIMCLRWAALVVVTYQVLDEMIKFVKSLIKKGLNQMLTTYFNDKLGESVCLDRIETLLEELRKELELKTKMEDEVEGNNKVILQQLQLILEKLEK